MREQAVLARRLRYRVLAARARMAPASGDHGPILQSRARATLAVAQRRPRQARAIAAEQPPAARVVGACAPRAGLGLEAAACRGCRVAELGSPARGLERRRPASAW